MEQFVIKKKSIEGKAPGQALPRPDGALGEATLASASDTVGRVRSTDEHDKRVAATFGQVWDNPVPGRINFEGTTQRILDAHNKENQARSS